MAEKVYGIELVIDLHHCDPSTFTRESIGEYLKQLCEKINMVRADLHWWDYKGEEEAYEKAPDHLKGTSVVQFIKTSTIVIHTLDVLEKAFVNVFTCNTDDFNVNFVVKFTSDWFKGKVRNATLIERI